MQDRNYRNNSERNDYADDSKTQLFIAKGRNDGMDPKSLVDFISSETNIDQGLISNVKVLDAFSFFAVPNEDAGMILDFFQQQAGEGRPLVSKAKRKKPAGSGGSGSFGGGFRNDRREGNRFGERRGYGSHDE